MSVLTRRSPDLFAAREAAWELRPAGNEVAAIPSRHADIGRAQVRQNCNILSGCGRKVAVVGTVATRVREPSRGSYRVARAKVLWYARFSGRPMMIKQAIRSAANTMGFDIHRISNAQSRFGAMAVPTTSSGTRRWRSPLRGSHHGSESASARGSGG
jgi:hypothetical protein